MRDLKMDIADDIERGELSFHQIAVKHGVTYDDVSGIAFDLQLGGDLYDEEYVFDNDYEDDYDYNY